MMFSQLPFATLSLILLALTLSQAAGQSASDLYRITDGVTQSRTEFHQVSVPMGREHILANLKGPGKVTYFYITDDSVGKWNPGLVLKVYWDDATEPAIWVPLADFFGAVMGRSVDYQSAVMQINHACFMCYLPMPFSKRARFILANDGDQDYSRKVAYGIDHEQSRAYAKEKSRLHCEWRRSNPVTNGLHTILDARGRGQYVGSILQAVSRNQKIWFGEGDTVLHLDGKTFAHTPGTEDEYGSCWEDPNWRTFSAIYCGHPLNQNGINRMYRWYVANPVRFQKRLKVEIQNQHENGTPTTNLDSDDYTSLAFWYQDGSQKVARLPSFKERTGNSFPDRR
jgi:hypothetical protein